MPKHQRLSRADFLLMDTARSRRFYGAYFNVSIPPQKVENSINKPKFACIVSKKIAARAVDRNRIRRLCKEAFRTTVTPVTQAQGFIFYAKKESKRATFADVISDVKELLSKAE